ncbi:MAG: sugar transferase [Patescibacteria group bacterium]|nr:sugar transferase [Patescibacteria group bacterium]
MSGFSNSRSTATLIVGDALAYVFSLILTLAIRYGEIPGRSLLGEHMRSFSILIVIFILVNFSAGLYDKRAALVRNGSRNLFLTIQIIDIVIGVVFFYFAPVSIAPKANLVIYFIVATAMLYFWRTIMYPVVSHARRQPAILVGSGPEIEDLRLEVNGSSRYGLIFVETIDPHAYSGRPADLAKAVSSSVADSRAQAVAADMYDEDVESAMPSLYPLVFSGVQVIDAERLYESIFDRVPLSIVSERWLIEQSNAVLASRVVYDGLKRLIDIAIAVFGGIVSLVFYPFVWAAIKMEDGGPLFITQTRTGKNGRQIRITKFRTMSGNDEGKYGSEGVTKNKVTKVGAFLRKSRIDEFPQFWNVLKGDLSMVGPRPELPALVSVYEKEIPYYSARHLVKPGVIGWALIYHQAHPHHAIDTEETANKLSYDLFYIKNRSFGLDLKIVFRTIQVLLRRLGK